MSFKTTTLCDTHANGLQIAEPIFQDFGGRVVFSGPIVTLKVFEDKSLIQAALDKPGEGRVLVVDGGASMHCALLGGRLAAQAEKNGWAGVVINGCIRDSATLAKINLGVKAIAIHPRNSFKHGIGERGIPLRFAGVHFLPDQYLYADEDGLVVSEQPLL